MYCVPRQGPRVKKALAEVVASLQAESAAAASESKPISVDDPVVAVTNGSDLPAAPREPIVTASTPAVPSRGDGGASLGQVPPAPRTSDIRSVVKARVEVLPWRAGFSQVLTAVVDQSSGGRGRKGVREELAPTPLYLSVDRDR